MSERAQTIVITGFMGAGKTTVSSALARRLACSMIDLDRFIEEREGRTPQVIIDEDGEPKFREIESRALREALATKTARIIALGGGTWTISSNRVLINEHGAFTVWLDAPFELCWQRITRVNLSRPLARDFGSARRLYDERRAVYDQAMLRVRVNEGKSAGAIAAEIADALPRAAEEQT
jgi:shikimate kinase